MHPEHKKAVVRFRTTERPIKSVSPLIGEGGIKVGDDAFTAFETITRPQRVGLINFAGYTPLTLEIPVLFDNLNTNKTIEPQLKSLSSMARVAGESPPVVKVSAPNVTGQLVPYSGTKWVINAIAWGDAVRNSTGNRVRQAATVTLLQYIADPRLKELSVAKRLKDNKTKKPHTSHVVKQGETLLTISQMEYGTTDRWRDIATANDIYDPRRLKVGKRLKLPR